MSEPGAAVDRRPGPFSSRALEARDVASLTDDSLDAQALLGGARRVRTRVRWFLVTGGHPYFLKIFTAQGSSTKWSK